MKTTDSGPSGKMQQLLSTEEEDRSLQLFTREMYNSLTKAGSEEMIQQLNQ